MVQFSLRCLLWSAAGGNSGLPDLGTARFQSGEWCPLLEQLKGLNCLPEYKTILNYHYKMHKKTKKQHNSNMTPPPTQFLKMWTKFFFQFGRKNKIWIWFLRSLTPTDHCNEQIAHFGKNELNKYQDEKWEPHILSDCIIYQYLYYLIYWMMLILPCR